MLSLKQPLDDKIRIGNREYHLDLSFDNALRWYDLMDDKSLKDMEKIMIAFEMFVPDGEATIPEQVNTIESISKYIADAPDTPDDGQEDNQTHYYSFSKDADYIFASFYAEYGIDLIDQQGKLRWEKFIALFRGMSDKAKINQIIGIRAAPLPAGNSEYEKSERERLLQLKAAYSLDDGQSVADGDARMDKMFDSLVNMAKEGGTFS